MTKKNYDYLILMRTMRLFSVFNDPKLGNNVVTSTHIFSTFKLGVCTPIFGYVLLNLSLIYKFQYLLRASTLKCLRLTVWEPPIYKI